MRSPYSNPGTVATDYFSENSRKRKVTRVFDSDNNVTTLIDEGLDDTSDDERTMSTTHCDVQGRNLRQERLSDMRR
ncbi:hypothetical protein AB4072_09195 [Microvirga sp. 2MCAF38]|uniref:hypothetical protein n=1 Tax=Microvirga sp. 2MCAF38 TaxID=3232989 RepID=UPI003F956172